MEEHGPRLSDFVLVFGNPWLNTNHEVLNFNTSFTNNFFPLLNSDLSKLLPAAAMNSTVFFTGRTNNILFSNVFWEVVCSWLFELFVASNQIQKLQWARIWTPSSVLKRNACECGDRETFTTCVPNVQETRVDFNSCFSGLLTSSSWTE